MSAADKKMDDSGPQNWVVPEVMKPEEKELVEKLTQVMSKNTFHRAKEATRLARSYSTMDQCTRRWGQTGRCSS